MCFGNRIGFEFQRKLTENELFMPHYGSFIIELDGAEKDGETVIGKTTEEYNIFTKDYTLSLDSLQKTWESKLEPVFPCRIKTVLSAVESYEYDAKKRVFPTIKTASLRYSFLFFREQTVNTIRQERLRKPAAILKLWW